MRDDEYGRLVTTPQEVGGANTQNAYLVVAQIDAHYEQAKAAGAEIVTEIADQDYGGRLYTVRDPEGHHRLLRPLGRVLRGRASYSRFQKK